MLEFEVLKLSSEIEILEVIKPLQALSPLYTMFIFWKCICKTGKIIVPFS